MHGLFRMNAFQKIVSKGRKQNKYGLIKALNLQYVFKEISKNKQH